MASLNKVFIIGKLGRDPEVRYTPSGAAVCTLSVASERRWKSRDSGEMQKETEWHRVVCYDRQAEAAGEYLKKGKEVHIEGRLKTRKWQDKDGKDNYTTEVVVENLQFLSPRDSGGGDDRGEAPAPAPRPRASAPSRGQETEHRAPPTRQAPPPTGGSFDDMDDDIPF